ncbi:MAG: DUF362 domain-containing protein [Candidatus Omnitrophota bacterium]
MKKFTRREFVKTSLGFGAGLAAQALLPEYIYGKETIISPSIVGVIKGNDIRKTTEQALAIIGGVGKVVKPRQIVFIKPNYITGGLMGHDPVTAGEIPHPEVVAAVARECVKAGAKHVIIGEWIERPLNILWQGKKNIEGAQVKKLIEEINKKYGNKVSLINLREHTKSFIYVPSCSKLDWLAIPDIVKKADTVISIAVLKTHHWPISVTLGMKNFMGIMPSVIYGEPRAKLHQAGIHQVIVDINKGIKPRLTVISGAYGMQGEGVVKFLGGKTVDISAILGGALVIAGFDPVATDATATRIITRNWQPRPKNKDLGVPWYVKHLRLAYQQGLGQIKESMIEIKGDRIADVSMDWEMPANNTYPELPNYV